MTAALIQPDPDEPDPRWAEIERETQRIVGSIQTINRCDRLLPYDRTTTIDVTDDEDLRLGTSIELREYFRPDMTAPEARVIALVSIVWPVTGDEQDEHWLPTHFIGSFKATAAMYDDGRSIVTATQQARRWRDSTVEALLVARDLHRQTIGGAL